MHWKKLINPDYLGAYSLEDNGTYNNKVVTIESVAMGPVTGQGGKIEQCVIAQISKDKPMILNRTNMKRIERVLKTPDINQWAGQRIELTVEVDKTHGDVLRVVPKAPQLPELTETHKHWAAIIEALKNGKTDLQRLKAKYTISTETIKLLTNGNS